MPQVALTAMLSILTMASPTAVALVNDDDGDGVPNVCDADSPNRYLDTERKTTPTGGVSLGQFGDAVAVDGEWAVVGAPYDGENGGTYAGAAYVFQRNADGRWIQRQKLLTADGRPDHRLGISVDIDFPLIALGASYEGDGFGGRPEDRGAAYVFRYQPDQARWEEESKFLSSAPVAYDYFGSSVAVEGDRLVVGAMWDDEFASQAGAAFVFERQTDGVWALTTKLLPSEADGGRFGDSVSISGPRILIGAQYEFTAGRGYVFVEDGSGGWIEEAKFKPSDGSDAGAWRFGYSVALDGDIAVISAPQAEAGDEPNSGQSYVYRRTEVDGVSAWTEEAILFTSQPTRYAGWGEGTDIDGGRIVVGAYYASGVVERTGTAHIFERDGAGIWQEVAILQPSDGVGNDGFGAGVGISGDFVVIGSEDADATPGWAYGTMYGYRVATGDCDQNGVLDICDPDVDEDGLPDVCDDQQPPANDDCSGAALVRSGVNFGDSTFATDSGIDTAVTCSSQHGPAFRRDVWFSYTVECSGFVTVSTCGADFDTRLDIFADTGVCQPAGLNLIDCGSDDCGDDASVQTLAVEGLKLLIRVGSHLDVGGPFELEIVNDSIVPGCVAGPGQPCPGDINGDGIVDAADLGLMIAVWGTFDADADLDDDGNVDAADLGLLVAYWGTCS